MKQKILVTGAGGQIGTELTAALRERYGIENVIGADLKKTAAEMSCATGITEYFDICDFAHLQKVIARYQIQTIYHLAGILSAVGEKNPQLAWDINIGGLRNVLEASRLQGCNVFFPSSIGAFGHNTPAVKTPQDTIQRPCSIYGIAKVAGELLCDYYYSRFGVDTRGLRFPGLISYRTKPGGGTTDYAVDIYYAAVQHQKYTCFLSKNTFLDMMYMPDAVRATIELMEAAPQNLKHRNAFNITAMSFSPEQIADHIREIIPDFTIEYKVDPVRQAIADSWPDSLDDSAARKEWGWQPKYDLQLMSRDMISHLQSR